MDDSVFIAITQWFKDLIGKLTDPQDVRSILNLLEVKRATNLIKVNSLAEQSNASVTGFTSDLVSNLGVSPAGSSVECESAIISPTGAAQKILPVDTDSYTGTRLRLVSVMACGAPGTVISLQYNTGETEILGTIPGSFPPSALTTDSENVSASSLQKVNVGGTDYYLPYYKFMRLDQNLPILQKDDEGTQTHSGFSIKATGVSGTLLSVMCVYRED
jgi:hypothetical protein